MSRLVHDTDDVPPLKVCIRCNTGLPMDAAHFDRNTYSPDGFRNTCKACRAQERKANRDEALEEKIERLDQATIRALDVVSQEGAKIPHLVELFEEVVHALGGQQGVAQHIIANLCAAAPGSPTRTKMLEMVIRMGTKVSEMGGARKPLDTMTDDELEALANEQMKRIALYNPGNTGSNQAHAS